MIEDGLGEARYQLGLYREMSDVLLRCADIYGCPLAALDRRIRTVAKYRESVRLFMSTLWVGPIAAMAAAAALADAAGFSRSSSVRANLSLTPGR